MTYVTAELISPADFFSGAIRPACGAMSSFFGMVRNEHHDKAVRKLYYECYVPMAEKQIDRIRTQVMMDHGLAELMILHRIGEINVGEIAIAVVSWSGHRAEAFSGCRETVEKIKHEVPIWKNEFYEDGTHAWVSCLHDTVETSIRGGI